MWKTIEWFSTISTAIVWYFKTNLIETNWTRVTSLRQAELELPHWDELNSSYAKKQQFLEKLVNLSKKRKLAITHSTVNLTNLLDEATRNNTFSFDNPNCSQLLDFGNLNMQTSLCDANNFKKDMLEKRSNMFVCDENLWNTVLQSQDQNFQDWGQICRHTCLSCKAENIIEQSAVKTCCKKCDEEQYVAQPCCSDKYRIERFALKYRDNYIDCALRKSEMMRMHCSEKFQPKMKLDNSIFECVQCSKYANFLYV